MKKLIVFVMISLLAFVCCARHEHPGPQYTEPKIRPIESEPDIRYWVEGEVIERDVRRGMGEIRYKYCTTIKGIQRKYLDLDLLNEKEVLYMFYDRDFFENTLLHDHVSIWYNNDGYFSWERLK